MSSVPDISITVVDTPTQVFAPAQLGLPNGCSADDVREWLDQDGVFSTIRELDLLEGCSLFIEVHREGELPDTAEVKNA